MTIGIVILNYLAYEDTIECINSIKKQVYQDYHIVLVDNDSKNDSFRILNDLYKLDSKITLIKSAENIGFAKGNNLGIAYLKKMDIFNILVINGDTILDNPNYLNELVTLDVPHDVAMIGTKIISRDGKNQNTLPVSLINGSKIKKTKFENRLLFLLVKLNLVGTIKLILSKLAKSEIDSIKVEDDHELKVLDPEKNMLHGAAIYFTENYLKKYIGFYPDTFLYYEEELLALLCRKLDYKQMYTSKISIYHKEDASSDLLHKTSRSSLLFKLRIIKNNISIMNEAVKLPVNRIAEKVTSNE
ncbi:glycosyltransferase [Enterococcus sp. 22-H-5-01]|uniref:glycosyltransferase n=1 Tax=Enterococcus sp. 22-H-5-01 TaxID=3418555 RepID=UPI003CFD2536